MVKIDGVFEGREREKEGVEEEKEGLDRGEEEDDRASNGQPGHDLFLFCCYTGSAKTRPIRPTMRPRDDRMIE